MVNRRQVQRPVQVPYHVPSSISSSLFSIPRFYIFYTASRQMLRLIRIRESQTLGPGKMASSNAWLQFVKNSRPLEARASISWLSVKYVTMKSSCSYFVPLPEYEPQARLPSLIAIKALKPLLDCGKNSITQIGCRILGQAFTLYVLVQSLSFILYGWFESLQSVQRLTLSPRPW